MSVIIPCYNELESIEVLYKKSQFITENYDIQIIFLDNGSEDGTLQKFNSLTSSNKIKFFRINTNKGYGYGIKKSIKLCDGEYIGWTHADLQTDLFDLIKAFNIIKKKINSNNKKFVIKGIRFARPLKDRFFSFSMSIIGSILFFPLGAYEICAQPSVFHKSIIKEIDNAPNGYDFDLYVFIIALIKGFVPLRFPVLFLKREHGKSHWNKNIISKLIFIKNMFWSLINIFLKKRLGRTKMR